MHPNRRAWDNVCEWCVDDENTQRQTVTSAALTGGHTERMHGNDHIITASDQKQLVQIHHDVLNLRSWYVMSQVSDFVRVVFKTAVRLSGGRHWSFRKTPLSDRNSLAGASLDVERRFVLGIGSGLNARCLESVIPRRTFYPSCESLVFPENGYNKAH